MKIFPCLALMLLALACQQRSDPEEQQLNQDSADVVETDTPIIDTNFVSPEKHAFMEFSVTKENTVIRLRDWQKDVPMNALGTPADTTREILGHGADTHMGAALHTYTYPDLKLIYYGPKNGTDTWLNKISVTGGDWTTARGIHVGDPIEDLKGMYPKADNQTTGDANLYRYQLDESTIEFHTAEGKIRQIDIIYNIP